MQPLRSIRARVRSLGPARVDALIAAAFLVEGLLEAALLYGDARYAWIGVARDGADRGRRSPCAAARRSPRSRSPSPAFMAFQPLGREVNDNIYAPFFAVLFLLFSFGLFEPSGRRAAGRLRARVRGQRRRHHDRLVSEHGASTSSSAGS